MAVLDIGQESILDGKSILLILAAVVVTIIAWQKLQVKIDVQEPPLIHPKWPFLGHLFGILQKRHHYYHDLGLENPNVPIFTVPLGPGKLYCIVSPQLIQQMLRKKTISFDPITISFADRMMGFGPNIMHLMRNPPPDGSTSWSHEQHRAYDVLSSGPSLYKMNADVLNRISDVFNAVGPEFETKRFYLWIRGAFTLATAKAMFGENNPLVDHPKMNDYVWDYETGMGNLLVNPVPSLIARTPYLGRAALQRLLREFFRGGYDEKDDVSEIIKRRAAINRKWGVPIDDVADHELGMLFVAVTNAIPTLFWMIFYVFRDAQLVEDLKAELQLVMTERSGSDSRRECCFDVSQFATSCPLLNATYQEVMRVTNNNMGTRVVMEDTFLDYTPTGLESGEARTYLLKKDTPVQTPAHIINFSAATWGPDAHEFKPRRHITSKEQERQQKRALIPFGGGKHLCPGRHFAYAEIMGTISVLVMGYDLLRPDGARIVVPPINNNLAEAVGKPLQVDQQSLLTNIRRRPGWEDVTWGFVSGNEI